MFAFFLALLLLLWRTTAAILWPSHLLVMLAAHLLMMHHLLIHRVLVHRILAVTNSMMFHRFVGVHPGLIAGNVVLVAAKIFGPVFIALRIQSFSRALMFSTSNPDLVLSFAGARSGGSADTFCARALPVGLIE